MTRLKRTFAALFLLSATLWADGDLQFAKLGDFELAADRSTPTAQTRSSSQRGFPAKRPTSKSSSRPRVWPIARSFLLSPLTHLARGYGR